MTTPFDTSTAILDAAGRGATVPGYEAVGGLLLDLTVTGPVPPGAALASSGVAAACAVTAPGPLATLAGLVKPTTIVISLAATAVVAALALASPGRPLVVSPDPVPSGVARVVSTPAPGPLEFIGLESGAEGPTEADTSTIPQPDAAVDRLGEPAGPGEPAASGPGGGVTPASPATTAPAGDGPSPTGPSTSGPAGPSTSAPSTAAPTTVPSTTGPTTTAPSTTVASPTTTVDPFGNNGNGNGNGVGNGKGNQGNGNPGGPNGGGSGGGRP